MLPKVQHTSARESVRNSFGAKSYAYHREVSHLLRSTGHQLVDGRRLGNDPFHVYRELERPGTSRPLSGLAQEILGEPAMVPLTWKLSFGRGLYGYDYTYDYDYPLPDVDPPPFGDYVLGLNDFGTTAIERTRPGNPIASLGQFIGEIHDLPQWPKILYHRSRYLRDIGENYLNIEFGWKPFISDIRKMYRYTQVVNGRLLQLIRDNGLPIRRTRKEVSDETSTIYELYESHTPFGPYGPDVGRGTGFDARYYLTGPSFDLFGSSMPGTARFKWSQQNVVETRFSGTFRYYVPDIGSLRWTNAAKLALMGGDLSPSLVWEIMPWSWLFDWFANLGSIISNLSANAVENEVLSNAYVTKHILVRDKIDVDVTWDYYHQPYPELEVFPGDGTVSYLHEKETKLRQPSNPFAFGTPWADWSSFSYRQLALLAALGITRVQHH